MTAIPANKKIRQMKGSTSEDVLAAGSLTFNRASGGQKNMAIGQHLKPHKDASGTYTTNFTAIQALKPGAALAVYNNSAVLAAITVSNNPAVTALAAGATNTDGDVGVACKPNDWTLISMYDHRYVIASAATLLVYIVEDDTYIADENPNR